MKPGLRKILLSISVGLPLLLVLLSVATVYLLHQPDFVKTRLQRQLAAATGWDLQITGDLLLDWGKTSVIEAHGLKLSNPQRPQAQELFTAKQLRLQFHPLALIDLKLDMQDLHLQGCQINLHRDADGKSNWSLASNADAEPPRDAGDSGFSWNLKRLEIQSCRVQVSSAEQPEPVEARLDQALLQVDPQQVLTALIHGALDQQTLLLQGSLSPLPALWQGGYLQHAIDLQAGETRLHSEGSVADLRSGAEADLRFQFSGPEFSRITRWLALPEFSRGEFDADISVRKAASSGIMLIGINADLGSLEIQGQGELDKLLAPGRGRLELQVKGPDLEALGRTFGLPGLLAQPFEASFSAAIENHEIQLELQVGQTTAQLQADLNLPMQLEGSTARWKLHSTDWRELWPEAPADLETGEISFSGEWLRSGGADVFNSLQLSSSLAEVSGSGRMVAAAEGAGPADHGRVMKFSFDIRGDNASRLNPFVGPLFDSQAFALQFTASLDSGRISSQDIHFRQAKTDLTAELDMLLAERPVINSKLRSALLDLTPLQQHVVANRAGQPAARAPEQKLLFTDQAINLVGDIPFDLTLDLAIDELLFGANQLRKLSFELELLPQSLQLRDFEFQGGRGGHYAGHFSAERQADGTALKLAARAADLKLGVIGVSGQDPDSLPPSDILLDVSGKGSTWHELAQTLSGKARWYTGSGRISNTGLDFLFSDLLTQILSTLNPLSHKSQFTQLNCGVYAADMLNGQVKLAPVVIQTDQITAFSEGQVDLSSEAVDMNFRMVPRKGLGISAGSVVNPFFRIGGTLMKPALQLDVTKGAISGGVMVATAGLSVLFKSVSDRLLSSKDPCGDARQSLEQRDSAEAKH